MKIFSTSTYSDLFVVDPSASLSKGGEQDPYRNSGDIHRLKSVHLDRKLSATAHLPKRSTVVESPTGTVAQASNVHTQRSQEFGHGTAHRPINVSPTLMSPFASKSLRPPVQPQLQTTLQQVQQQQQRSQLSLGDPQLDSQSPKAPFARVNSEVKIVDDSVPSSPAHGVDDPSPLQQVQPEDSITLADIPQLVEAAQARAQHRSLPRESSIPYIAELSTLELAIVKHAAVVILSRSPLRDHLDMDEIAELLEVKKGGFWKQLFKAGNSDKRNVKKKGMCQDPVVMCIVTYLPLRCFRCAPRAVGGARGC
jgi:hypothetical protein